MRMNSRKYVREFRLNWWLHHVSDSVKYIPYHHYQQLLEVE